MSKLLSVKNSNGVITVEVPDDFKGAVKIVQKGTVVLESTLPKQSKPGTGPAKPQSSNPPPPPPPPPH